MTFDPTDILAVIIALTAVIVSVNSNRQGYFETCYKILKENIDNINSYHFNGKIKSKNPFDFGYISHDLVIFKQQVEDLHLLKNRYSKYTRYTERLIKVLYRRLSPTIRIILKNENELLNHDWINQVSEKYDHKIDSEKIKKLCEIRIQLLDSIIFFIEKGKIKELNNPKGRLSLLKEERKKAEENKKVKEI